MGGSKPPRKKDKGNMPICSFAVDVVGWDSRLTGARGTFQREITTTTTGVDGRPFDVHEPGASGGHLSRVTLAIIHAAGAPQLAFGGVGDFVKVALAGGADGTIFRIFELGGDFGEQTFTRFDARIPTDKGGLSSHAAVNGNWFAGGHSGWPFTIIASLVRAEADQRRITDSMAD